MDISEKKTVLDDTASIYERREEKTDRQKWKDLKGFHAKWEQFRAYYLFKVLIWVGVACLAVYAIYSFVKPKKEQILFVAILDNVIPDARRDRIQAGYDELMKIDSEKQETYFDTSMLVSQRGDPNSRSKLTAFAFAGELDVVIARESVFKEMASSYFRPLSEQLPADLYSEMKDRFCSAPEYDDYGKAIEGSEKPLGLYIEDKTGSQNNEGERLVIGICGNTGHALNAEEFLRFLLNQ